MYVLYPCRTEVKFYGKDTCVVDYVWNQVRGKKGSRTYDYDRLKDEIYRFCEQAPWVGTYELISWAKEPSKCINPRVRCTQMYRKFVTHSNGHPDITLVFVVKDHHLFPVLGPSLKLTVSRSNKGRVSNLLKHMAEFKWTRCHDKIKVLGKLDDIYEIECSDYIIILPEGADMKEAISLRT